MCTINFLLQMAEALPLGGVCYYVNDVVTYPTPLVRKSQTQDTSAAAGLKATQGLEALSTCALFSHAPLQLQAADDVEIVMLRP